jgi:hypothetical protein
MSIFLSACVGFLYRLVDEPKMVDDPLAVRPEDWDESTDGEWEAPKVINPKCEKGRCGPWTAPLIKNPKYAIFPACILALCLFLF